MNRRSIFVLVSFLLALMMIMSFYTAVQGRANFPESVDADLGSGFTYQGRLTDSSGTVNDLCDFKFSLYGSETGTDQIDQTLVFNNEVVSDGYFTIETLDFNASSFDGNQRFLEIDVACPTGSGAFEKLSPRQEINPTPYAIYAVRTAWTGIQGLPGDFADGDISWSEISDVPVDLLDGDQDTTYISGNGLELVGGTFHVLTSTIQSRVTETCPVGSSIRVIHEDGTVLCEEDNRGYHRCDRGRRVERGWTKRGSHSGDRPDYRPKKGRELSPR